MLEQADLSHNDITALRDLAEHPSLRRLILAHNGISRIEGLGCGRGAVVVVVVVWVCRGWGGGGGARVSRMRAA